MEIEDVMPQPRAGANQPGREECNAFQNNPQTINYHARRQLDERASA